ncbi:outer membrane lipoprotein SlyB [Sphingobium sp. OAS761]|uniref:glycine zipper 2TM domain-containing protein n=1 Tax=Sphingobium sp. OAS761 TaxID=2817901 RepID=UPI00209FC580|nr:glycine zipper 2TM domain-containing protein [Sphingobium sp. OAS761]MCP1468667.1 outer membrane lipoprotein SlyB [Sphingobium sp. OAS761]
MRKPLIAVAMVAMMPLGACATDNYGNGYNRPAPRPHGAHHRRLGNNDYIYRDNDGRYYCKRDDGTTGTIVGAIAGGVLGNLIAPGGSKTLGTILGAGGGALAGRAIDKNDINCE